MVDVSAKDATVRVAVASGRVRMNDEARKAVKGGASKKGDVLAVARLAAIQATKLTSQLIPLCHAIPIEAVDVDFRWVTENGSESLECSVTTRTTGKTGVEMEALTGVSVGCLTVYDMLKSVDRAMEISAVQLQHKSGGKSGEFFRDGDSSV